jgi:serine/threonine protein phosphatase PrpC
VAGAANEDVVRVVECAGEVVVLIVADGRGGTRAGDQAAGFAAEEMGAALKEGAGDRDQRRSAILQGFDRANERVLGMGVGAGTTLAVVEIDGDQVRPYHAGDSFMLVVGQRGKIKFQNIAHSPIGYAVESGIMKEEEAILHEDRSLVSNMVGSSSMSVDVGPTVRLSARDTVVVASDGLSDNLTIGEIVELSRTGALASVGELLAKEAHRRMVHPEEGHPSKPDDLTFALYRRVKHR